MTDLKPIFANDLFDFDFAGARLESCRYRNTIGFSFNLKLVVFSCTNYVRHRSLMICLSRKIINITIDLSVCFVVAATIIVSYRVICRLENLGDVVDLHGLLYIFNCNIWSGCHRVPLG